MKYKFSVIIPLYNKEAEVERAIRSVLVQTVQPIEIVIVDDGSTDGSAAVVEAINSPLVKLIRQKNAGVSVARNRGMEEASGDYFALLDADDEWRPEFLAEIAVLIEEFPDAGLYCTGFDIERGGKLTPGRTPENRGIVENYFREATTRFVAMSSSSVIYRAVFKHLGGFPEGMKIGEDLYMWIKIALAYPVAFTPERLLLYHISASNRSTAIYTPEKTKYSFKDFYDKGNFWLNEYIARAALGKALTITAKISASAYVNDDVNAYLNTYAYNRYSRRLWWRLWILDRLPALWRPVVYNWYNRLAWVIVKRGL